MSLKHFHWRGLCLVEDVPVVHAGICHETKCVLIKEFPENNILVHSRRLQLRLVSQIEDLQCPLLCLQCYYELVPVHDGAVGLDRSPYDIVSILEINDDDFGRRVVIELLSYTDVVVGF